MKSGKLEILAGDWRADMNFINDVSIFGWRKWKGVEKNRLVQSINYPHVKGRLRLLEYGPYGFFCVFRTIIVACAFSFSALFFCLANNKYNTLGSLGVPFCLKLYNAVAARGSAFLNK